VTAKAFAVVDRHGDIYVSSVSISRRGAIVNWLWQTAGIQIMSYHTEAAIEKFFEDVRGKCQVAEVMVSLP